MEVHAHSHTARKKWTHYFWEFLMLFLAVYCGFLAENFREHQIEHQREKKFMITLLEDLKSDTAHLKKSKNEWEYITNSIDSVADAITFPLSSSNLSKIYRHLNNALNYSSFTYNDRTIAQLKNSGGFRLIRKEMVANKIVEYDQFNNDAFKVVASQHNSAYEDVTRLRNKIFAQDILYKIYKKYGFGTVPISDNFGMDNLIARNNSFLSEETQTKILFEFKNALLAYRIDFDHVTWSYEVVQQYADGLIKMIEELYRPE